jgi:hypothetical protein
MYLSQFDAFPLHLPGGRAPSSDIYVALDNYDEIPERDDLVGFDCFVMHSGSD